MIVKQLSLDIEVYDENYDLEALILDILKDNKVEVLGSSQIDVSEYYNTEKKEI